MFYSLSEICLYVHREYEIRSSDKNASFRKEHDKATLSIIHVNRASTLKLHFIFTYYNTDVF